MTWQGSGGQGAPGGPDDDATRPDNPVSGSPPPFTPPPDDSPTAPVPPPPDLGMPPAAPPDLVPPGLPPAPGAPAPSPWAAPAAGAWAAAPSEGGRFAVPGAPGLVYAGTGARFVAYLIDAILLAVVSSIITLPFASSIVNESLANPGAFDAGNPIPVGPTAGIGTVVLLVLEAAYFVLLWSSSGRATLGMRLLKLQVGDATTGNRIPVATGFRRWLAFGSWLQLLGFVPILGAFASLATFAWQLILLVTTASHPQKQGLHDRFANTAIVQPLNAGSGGVVIGCIVIAIAIAILSIVALIFLGGQVSAILSAVGESV